MNMKKKWPNIGLVTFPLSRAGNIPLSNLVDILSTFSTCVHVITGNEANIYPKEHRQVRVYRIDHKTGANALTRIISYIGTQLRICYQLARLTRDVKLWVFFIGGEGLLLPMVTAKLLRRQVLLALAGFPESLDKEEKDSLFKITGLLARMNLGLSDRIIVYSERIIVERNLEKHRDKIFLAHEHFLNFDAFKIQKPLSKRQNLVGYIGNLSRAKGITNLLEAIPRILERESGVRFLIGGEGELRSNVEEYLSKGNLSARVQFTGWIPHDDIPKCLTELKLLVLPSYTEGLPNIILEAMACGTPVLATAVGAIPDVVEDSETGFIMEDNSAEGIARNISRVLNHPNLKEITMKARALIEKEYTYEVVLEKYRNILAGLKIMNLS
jgi:glycosyltransferase involved in cell wall biosynthesis